MDNATTLIEFVDVSHLAAGDDISSLLTGGTIKILGPFTTLEIEITLDSIVTSTFRFRFCGEEFWHNPAVAECNSRSVPQSIHCLPVRKHPNAD